VPPPRRPLDERLRTAANPDAATYIDAGAATDCVEAIWTTSLDRRGARC
jgi:hypothetical protein